MVVWRCVLLVLLAIAASGAAEPGLMGYWPFDGDLTDASRHGHDAKAAKAQFAAGQQGQSLDPQTRGVEVADHVDLRLAPGLTIDTWAYFDRRPSGCEVLVTKDKEYLLRVDPPHEGGMFSFFVYLAGWEPRVHGPVPEPGRWYHLVATWDGVRTALTVNGETSSTNRPGTAAGTKNPLQIGLGAARMDDVRLLNPALARSRELTAIADQVPATQRTDRKDFFAASRASWVTTSGGAIAGREPDVQARLSGSAAVVQPALNVDLTGTRWISADVDAPGATVAHLLYQTDQGTGVVVVPVWPRGRTMLADMSGETAWAGRLKLLALAFPDGRERTVKLGGVWIGNRPLGSPYLYFRNLSPGRAALRAGREETVLATVRNLGATASAISAKIEAPAGVELLDGAARQLGELDYEGVQMASWRIRAPQPGTYTVRVRLEAPGAVPAEQALPLTITPALNLPRADYVPPPKPVKTDLLTLMHYCPLWKEGTHYGWGKIEPWPERRPAIGWYDEGTPEVADWHIKYALEHGVQGFIYCWYRANYEPKISLHIGHALEDGMLHARYLNQFKFTIMWENGCACGVKDRADLMNNVFPYWMRNYFKNPSYVKIDNKPLLYIWVPSIVSRNLGDEAQVKAAFDEMRAACRKEGFDGLYIVGCVADANRATLERMAREGWDASSAYGVSGPTTVPPGRDPEGVAVIDHRTTLLGQETTWKAKKAVGALPDIPTIMMGWDPRPWHGDRTTSYQGPARPEHYREACRRARQLIEATPGHGLDRRVVVFDNWNEFGEGHYLEPNSGFGFSFLDAIREVFSKDTGPHQDITPEDVGLPMPERRYLKRRELLGGLPDRPRKVVDHVIGWWRFDDVDEQVSPDSSATGLHGLKTGVVTAPGRRGRALLCQGGDVSVAAHKLLWPQEGLSLELWARTDVPKQSDRWMINTVGASTTGYRLGLSDGHLSFQIPKTEWSHYLSAPAPLPLGRWVHIVATYDNRTMRLYQDGQLVASRERGGAVRASNSNLCLGSYGTGHPRAFFQGLIDEVRLLDRALSADEVAARAKAGD